jgi:hypothetical protein
MSLSLSLSLRSKYFAEHFFLENSPSMAFLLGEIPSLVYYYSVEIRSNQVKNQLNRAITALRNSEWMSVFRIIQQDAIT